MPRTILERIIANVFAKLAKIAAEMVGGQKIRPIPIALQKPRPLISFGTRGKQKLRVMIDPRRRILEAFSNL
jgi:hypothetical protein